MFASLFKRAEASVDNAIGDLGNRIVIAVPFLIALGFGAYSLSLTWTRFYGPEVGNLLVAAAFAVVGLIAAIVVKTRSSRNDERTGSRNGKAFTRDGRLILRQ
jgi:hypothetical protein